MQVEKKRNFIIQFTYFLIIGVIAYFTAKYLFPLMSPFFVGLVIAIIARAIAKPLLTWPPLKNRSHMVHILVLLVIYFLIATVLVFGGTKLWDMIRAYFNRLPDIYARDIQPAINNIYQNISERFPSLEEAARASYQSINSSLIGFVEKISNTVLNKLTGFAGTVTGFLLRVVFTMISSVIFTLDLPNIQAFLKRQMNERTAFIYDHVLTNVMSTAVQFVRAYLIIITVTFTELYVGFSIIGFDNKLPLAVAIAIMDALPIIGTGTIMVPWILYTIFLGDFRLAFALFILYAIIFVVRQFMEPKVVGDQIGLHPLVMVMCLYAGGRLFGLAGIFLLPLAITIVNKLNKDKVIHVLK